MQTTHRSNIFSAKFLPGCGDDLKAVSCAGIGSVEFSEFRPDGEYIGHPFRCHNSITYQVELRMSVKLKQCCRCCKLQTVIVACYYGPCQCRQQPIPAYYPYIYICANYPYTCVQVTLIHVCEIPLYMYMC